ncbi:MAG: RlpA-like double-psi beta-barrel domain-containing protein [Armatimonadota bacterium]|nr:RlpA-like double-psi beta-barrel domain-containing protein [Armatimonadota bacterium]
MIVVVLLVALGALVGCVSVPRTGGRPTPAVTVGPTATATATPTDGPTSTATPAPTAGSFPVPTPATPSPGAAVYRVTWYGDEFAGRPTRCTGEPYDPEDPNVAAAGAAGPTCGARLRLCSESACIVVTVRDGCGGCGPRHLDLSRAGWNALGRPAEVVVTLLTVAEEPAATATPAPASSVAQAPVDGPASSVAQAPVDGPASSVAQAPVDGPASEGKERKR